MGLPGKGRRVRVIREETPEPRPIETPDPDTIDTPDPTPSTTDPQPVRAPA